MENKVEKDKVIATLDKISVYLTKNARLINWNKANSHVTKLEGQLRNFIVPPPEFKKVFSSKKLFPSISVIKSFVKKSLGIELKETTKTKILLEITLYDINHPETISRLLNSANSLKPTPKVRVREKTTKKTSKKTTKKISSTLETWKDWAKIEPNMLKDHLDKFSAPLLRKKAEKILSADDRKGKKPQLIENLIKKIRKLNAVYGMGPS